MSEDADPSREMQRFLQRRPQDDALELDNGMIERLLDGSVASDDVPPGYRVLVQTLNELRGGFTPAALAGEEQAVASIMAGLVDDGTPPRSPRRSVVRTRRRLVSVAAASFVGGASLLSGLAAANALPAPAQSVASDMLSKLGVSVPNPNSTHSNGHSQPGGHSQAPESAPPSTNGKGSDISGLAHTTPSTSVDKGAQISTEAGGGTSQAGQHGPGSPNTPQSSSPPPSAPHQAGHSTADTPNSGTSPPGSSTANTHSDGHNTTGSANSNNATSRTP